MFFSFLFGRFWKFHKIPYSTKYIIPQKKALVNSFAEKFLEILKKVFFVLYFSKNRHKLSLLEIFVEIFGAFRYKRFPLRSVLCKVL